MPADIPPGRRPPPPLEKVTVNLTGPTADALSRIVTATGASKTEAINRALRLYAWVQEACEAGGAVYVREAGGEPERLKLF